MTREEIEQEWESNWARIDKYFLITTKTLSETFMERHEDDLDWTTIAGYQKLELPFIEKHFDKLSKHNLVIQQSLSEDFIEKHVDDFEEYWNYLVLKQTINNFRPKTLKMMKKYFKECSNDH